MANTWNSICCILSGALSQRAMAALNSKGQGQFHAHTTIS